MIADSFFDLFLPIVNGIQAVLIWFHGIFASFGPTKAIGAFGLAIVAVTLIIRTLLFPVFAWQLRTARKLQRNQQILGPKMAELRKKHKGNSQQLNAAMMELHKEHGISPMASLSGCFPALVQMPVLISLYTSIRSTTSSLHSDLGFLWIQNVGKTGSEICCSGGQSYVIGALSHPTVLILPLLAGLATFVQSRMMLAPVRPDMSDQEKTMANVGKQMGLILPLIIFVTAINFYQGIAIYWVTQSMMMIAQQYHLVGWGGLNVPDWFPGKHRVTPLSHPKVVPAAAVAISSGDAVMSDQPPVSTGKHPSNKKKKRRR